MIMPLMVAAVKAGAGVLTEGLRPLGNVGDSQNLSMALSL